MNKKIGKHSNKNGNKGKSMKLMAAAMAVVITAGAAGICGYQRNVITAKASEVNVEELQSVAESALETDGEKPESVSDADGGEMNAAEEENAVKKEESVYVKADSTGNIKNTTVTEWIKNPGSGQLADVSELEDIENIKGEEAYQASGDSVLEWQSEGNDIYYQGTTKKELPVGVKVSYKLNGKTISAEDLKGKDGKVEIHIQYSNDSKVKVDVGGKEEEMFTPFTMITAMMLPTDEYQNVEIDHGRVFSDADKDIVVGLGFPGLSENLNLTDGEFDFELPKEVTITADVKHASVGPTITVASTDFLQDLDVEGMDGFDDLSDSIADLKDATNQLADGTKEAAGGAGELSAGAAALSDGTNALKNGTEKLAGGAGALKNGADNLAEGAGTLKNGIDTLDQKSGELIMGVQTLGEGIHSYTQGVQNLADAMDTSGLTEGSTQVADGAQAVHAGLQNLADGLGIAAPTGITEQVCGEAAAIQESLAGLENAIGNLSAKAQVIDNGGADVCCDVIGLEGYLTTVLSDPDAAGSAAAQIQQYFTAAGTDASAVAEVVGEDEALAQIQSIRGMAETMRADASASSNQIAGLMGQLQGALYGTSQQPGLIPASSQVAAGAGSVHAGIQQVQQGVHDLQSYNDMLSGGAAALLQGGEQLAGGVSQLSAGADALNSGAGALADGVTTLNSGSRTLLEGINTLDGGAAALADGANALADGNQALADGMAEYKAEAIDKLTDLFDGDISRARNRLKAMADLGKSYQSFAGLSPEMSGTTKFIIETEGIGE